MHRKQVMSQNLYLLLSLKFHNWVLVNYTHGHKYKMMRIQNHHISNTCNTCFNQFLRIMKNFTYILAKIFREHLLLNKRHPLLICFNIFLSLFYHIHLLLYK